MRFGQLPSVREMTPDITPLLQASQMKDQAFQNITGTISQLAAQKQQKELDKQKKQQAIAAVTPFLESLKQMNPKLKNVNFSAADLVGAVGADKAMSQVQDLMTALSNERNKAQELALQGQANKLARKKFKKDKKDEEEKEQLDNFNRVKGAEFSNLRASVVRDLGGSVKDVDTLEGITPSVVYDKVLEVYNSSPDKYKNLNKEDFSSLQSSVTDRLSEIAKAKGEARQKLGEGEMNFEKVKELYFSKKSSFLKGLNGTKETLNSQDRIRRTAGELRTFLEDYVASGRSQTIDQLLESKFRGSEFANVIAKVKALGGQVGASQLIAMRRNSKDGSSGFGQLTQAELTLLENLFGAIINEDGEIAPTRTLLDTMIQVEQVMEGRLARTEQIAREEFGALAKSYEIDNFESFMVPDGAPSASLRPTSGLGPVFRQDTNRTSYQFNTVEGLVPTSE